jgi:hypothetical protein
VVRLAGDPEMTIDAAGEGTLTAEFLALTVGHSTIRARAEGESVSQAITVLDEGDTDIEDGPYTLTAILRATGDVSSDPAGLVCESLDFNPANPTTCTADLPGSETRVYARANTDFGFYNAAFTGCDSVEENTCILDLASDRTVEVEFVQ